MCFPASDNDIKVRLEYNLQTFYMYVYVYSIVTFYFNQAPTHLV